MRPALLVEVQPQGRVVRHFAEHMAELAPLVQILDAPVPQLGEQLVDIFNIFRLFDTQTPVEQVIAAVARCSVRRRWQNSWWKCPPLCLSLRSSSSRWSRSLTFPFLILEGDLWHRTLTLQSFVVVVVSVEVVSKVFAQDRVLQRFLSRPFLQLRVVKDLVVVFKVSLQDRVQQRFLLQNTFLSGLWSKTSIFPVEVFMVFKVFSQDRVQLRFPSRCLFLQFTLQRHLSLSSWRLLPQFMRHLLLSVSSWLCSLISRCAWFFW